jgi:hypothetical protein
MSSREKRQAAFLCILRICLWRRNRTTLVEAQSPPQFLWDALTVTASVFGLLTKGPHSGETAEIIATLPARMRGAFAAVLDTKEIAGSPLGPWSISTSCMARRAMHRRLKKPAAAPMSERVTFKKGLRASEQDRPDVAKRRERWNLTFLAALRCDRLTAPCVIDGPINGPSSRLCRADSPPAPRAGRNCRHGQSRRAQGPRRSRRQSQALFPARLLARPQSIEQAFAKMRTLLRKADARTIGKTWRTISALLDCYTPTEWANYFRNAGYASP